ncbi:MAG: sigma-70 family RNA polymerase sigma factor [Kangiellaceae bacterium]|nr:sigma-70 family RNA polymerase sigma factor [Kangiellaceae bacterium]MCW8999378.1 sigma-70 family RNA polymerase sigma factor [Kangiellaceae bacterium]
MLVRNVDLWANYFESKDDSSVHALVEAYNDWLVKIVKNLFFRYHVEVYELSDYLHWGVIGLIESIRRYEQIEGADFKTFAYKRIRGEILNQVNQSTEKIAQKKYLKEKQVRERVDSLVENSKQESDFEQFYAISMGVVLGTLLESEFEADDEDSLLAGVYGTQLSTGVTSYLKQLSEKERIILNYHYYYHLTFAEIADLLELSKGRVSQIHSIALNKMKELIKKSDFEYFL